MLVHDKKHFTKGILMLGSFAVVFVCLLFPILKDENGAPLTGLQYADNVFNELSKGSSNFIPMVRSEVAKVNGKEIEVSVPMKKAELLPSAIAVLQAAGAQAKEENGRLVYKGDLGKILSSATDMSEKLYNNKGAEVSSMYNGMNHLEAASAWWYALSPSIKALQKQDKIAEAKVIDTVIRRAIEPGNNFYSLPPAKVSDHVILLAAMLIFYVLYTLWYGFSIFELFEGIGLAMTKSKSKSES